MIQAFTDCMEQMLNSLVKDFVQYIFDLRKCINKNTIKKPRTNKAFTSCLLCYHGLLSEKLARLSEFTISNYFLGTKDQDYCSLKRVVIFPVKFIGILHLQDT